jgi:meso-butanediol dehydrogenase/(S,S)-butanediol dehydrogenase/diacetyl reductase
MEIPKRLAGKTAVITGAGRRGGLGAGIAARLAAEGANIILADIAAPIDPATSSGEPMYRSEIEKLAAEISDTGVSVSSFICDVRDWGQVQALAAQAVALHGRLDIWVNNAGIGSIMKPLLTLQPEDWTKVIDVNLTGAFFGLRAAADVMVAQKAGGRIINIASQAAKSGFAHAQAYTASKHGLVGLVRSAAIELGPHGITVNNVCPNHVTTGLGAWQNEYFAEVTGHGSVESYMAAMRARIPMGRTGLPADTAAAVAFLCSDDAAYITAESMNVSGGEEPH